MVLMIQFGEFFLYYLICFTIFPCVVLYCSGDDYYQIWTKPNKEKVRLQNSNFNMITKILLPFKRARFYITHPGFTPRDTQNKVKSHHTNECASTSKNVKQITCNIKSITQVDSQDNTVKIDI